MWKSRRGREGRPGEWQSQSKVVGCDDQRVTNERAGESARTSFGVAAALAPELSEVYTMLTYVLACASFIVLYLAAFQICFWSRYG